MQLGLVPYYGYGAGQQSPARDCAGPELPLGERGMRGRETLCSLVQEEEGFSCRKKATARAWAAAFSLFGRNGTQGMRNQEECRQPPNSPRRLCRPLPEEPLQKEQLLQSCKQLYTCKAIYTISLQGTFLEKEECTFPPEFPCLISPKQLGFHAGRPYGSCPVTLGELP